jgi:hypothetical protein
VSCFAIYPLPQIYQSINAFIKSYLSYSAVKIYELIIFIFIQGNNITIATNSLTDDVVSPIAILLDGVEFQPWRT